MKVTQLISDLGGGGAQRMLAHLVSGLLRQGQDVSVVCLGSETHSQNQKLIEEAGVKIHYVRKRPGFDPAVPFRLHRLFKEIRPDVVHSHLSALAYASLAPSYAKVRSRVHTVHNLAEKEAPSMFTRLHRRAFHKGTIPVAIADAVESSIRTFHGVSDVPCIPNGIPVDSYAKNADLRDETRARLGVAPSTSLLVQVGRLFEQKNPLNLMQALKSDQLASVDFKCLLVGDGPLRGEVESYVGANGLGAKVELLGVRSDVKEILAAADVFTLSSDWEGHPLCILEAMASRVPIVSTSVGGVPEQLGEGNFGLLVPPSEPEALAEGIRRVLESRDLATQLAQGAFQEVAKYDVGAMTDAYVRLYQRR
jgi:glycosyltransferase involved in cell wall biosynthesis